MNAEYADRAAAAGTEALNTAKEQAEEIRERAQETFQDLASAGRDKASQLRDYIEEEPLKAVMIAAGLGLLLGALLRK